MTTKSNGWILCPSKSFPGKFYYFNVQNGKAAWCIDEVEKKVARSEPKDLETEELPEPTSPPIPEPRQEFSFSQTSHPSPIFGQSVFPKPLPKHDKANVIWTPIQIQLPILFQNESKSNLEYPKASQDYTTFGNDLHKTMENMQIQSNMPIVTQTKEFIKMQDSLIHMGYKDILVQSCDIPISQHFQNFEATTISFSEDNRDNIKRLNKKLTMSTPTRTKPVEPRQLFQLNNSLSFADLNITHNSQTYNKAPSTTTPKMTGAPSKLTNKPYKLTNIPYKLPDVQPKYTAVPSKMADTPSKLTDISSKLTNNVIKSSNFKRTSFIKDAVLNAGRQSNESFISQPSVLRKIPKFPPKINNIPLNNEDNNIIGLVETTKALLNVSIDETLNNEAIISAEMDTEITTTAAEISIEPSSYSSKIDEIATKTEKSIQPSLSRKKKDKIVPESNLKPCIKGNVVDNKDFASQLEDLRQLLAKKRKQEKVDSSREPLPKKKKVTFNLDPECLTLSSLDDDDDCNFIETHRATMIQLKQSARPDISGSWYLLPDTEVLLNEFNFIDNLVKIDASCAILVPSSILSEVSSIARCGSRGRATPARHVLRRLHSDHVAVQEDDKDGSTGNDAILKCCLDAMKENKHVVIISNNLELHTTAKCYPIPCYSMNFIKNGLANKNKHQFKHNMKITIKNNVDTTGDDDGLNAKEKDIIQKYKLNQLDSKITDKNRVETNKATNTIQNIYQNEILRIAEAIDIENKKPDDKLKKTTDEIFSLDPKKSSETKKSGQECIVNKNRPSKPDTDIDISKINKDPKDVVSVFFENSKPTDVNKYKTTEMKISFKNNNLFVFGDNEKAKNIAKEPLHGNVKKDSIFDICKEKHKIYSTNERAEANIGKDNLTFDKTKSNMAAKNHTVKQSYANDITYMTSLEKTTINSDAITYQSDINMSTPNKTNQNEIISNIAQESEKNGPILSESHRIANISGDNHKKSIISSKIVKNSKMTSHHVSENDIKSYSASQSDRNSKKLSENDIKSNMASENVKTFKMASPVAKLNMASVLESENILNRSKIDLSNYYVKNKVMEDNLQRRMDEWMCSFIQIMEEALTSVLEKLPTTALKLPPPYNLREALNCTAIVYKDNVAITKIIIDMGSYLYDYRIIDNKDMLKKIISPDMLKKVIAPEEFMKAFSCGMNLLKYLKKTGLTSVEIEEGVIALQDLIKQIEDENDPNMALNDLLIKTPFRGKTDEKVLRQNFVKDRSDITNYLKTHFEDWKDYDNNYLGDYKDNIFEDTLTCDLKPYNYTFTGTKSKDIAFDKNIGKEVPKNMTFKDIDNKERYKDINTFKSKNTFGYIDTQTNVGTFDKKLEVSNVNKNIPKGQKIIRNCGFLKEFENKLRKKRLSLIHKSKDEKPKENGKIVKNNVINNKIEGLNVKFDYVDKKIKYTPENDPKLAASPKVVIEAYSIREYEEKMNIKVKNIKKPSDPKNYSIIDKEAKDDDNNNNISNNKLNYYDTRGRRQRDNDKINAKDNDFGDNHFDNVCEDNDGQDNDNYKYAHTDSGLGNDSPGWVTVVESYNMDLNDNLQFIKTIMESSLNSLRSSQGESKQSFRLRAFEMDYLIGRILQMLRAISADSDRGRHVDAVLKYMEHAKSIHKLVKSILSVTNEIPISSSLSINLS